MKTFCCLYKLTMQNIKEVFLRQYCKEGAYVATQFFTNVFLKKPKIAKKQWNPPKMHFWYICIVFSIFNVISEEFKFSKVFWMHSTFNILILQSLIFLIESTLILFVFINKKKSKFIKNKNVEGPMCFGDQATLPINRGHNTHKRGGGRKFTGG